MKSPTTHKELKSFLGKLSYIRRFIPGLVVVTSAFASLLKKGASFHWSTAFEKKSTAMACIVWQTGTVASAAVTI
jgi:hypothetical protein